MMFQRLRWCGAISVLSCLSLSTISSASTVLMDSSASASLRAQTIPSTLQTSNGVVTIISSPGTPSFLVSPDDVDSNHVLSLVETEETLEQNKPLLVCRGATLRGASDAERTSLATCSLVAGAFLVDGITAGDVEAGLQNSRHARTLTALFQARIQLEETADDDEKNDNDEATPASSSKQCLIFSVMSEQESVEVDKLEEAVRGLYEAAAAEKNSAALFDDAYDIQVVSVTSPEDAQKAVSMAWDAAKSIDQSTRKGAESLSTALVQAHSKVRLWGVSDKIQDPPHIAQAFLGMSNSFSKHSRTTRARFAAWKSRVARGLWVDSYGQQATLLRDQVLGAYDQETLAASGLLSTVSGYRVEMRAQLQSLLDSGIEELYGAQISNLEKSTLKRLQKALLKTMNDPAESLIDSNAAAVRSEAFHFETIVDDLQVPALGLTKEKAIRDLSPKLNDAVLAFPDSPLATIKRTNQVKKTVNKEKKPNERGFNVGLDLVAVLRPDGFGSLQGFVGRQIGPHSVTFGIHNDADDPQVIAQFGGVRPPLLRVQPKLRLDIEM